MNEHGEVDKIKSDIDKEVEEIKRAWDKVVKSLASLTPLVDRFGRSCKQIDKIFKCK